jgi:hypothetical protein
MYDPCSLAFSFPPYPSGKKLGEHDHSFKGFLYRLKPFIGFDIWHVDPERNVPGQRRDDSCGWFPRNLTPELERAVAELGKPHWSDIRRRIEDAFATSYTPNVEYRSLVEMPMWVAFPTHLMVLQALDRIAFKRRRTPDHKLVSLASGLAFSTVDNLNGPWESPERYIRLLAACYRRELRPWWRHPRWHVHHWRIHFDLVRNVRRMFQRCATCKRPLGFGYCPTDPGDGTHHHGECLRIGVASA